jgi:hypothetical protein
LQKWTLEKSGFQLDFVKMFAICKNRIVAKVDFLLSLQIAILYLTIFAKLQILQKLSVCNDNTSCYLMQTALGFCLAGDKRANWIFN